MRALLDKSLLGQIQHIPIPFCESTKLDLMSQVTSAEFGHSRNNSDSLHDLSINPLLFHAHALNGINTKYLRYNMYF